jgi:hypothetical protein
MVAVMGGDVVGFLYIYVYIALGYNFYVPLYFEGQVVPTHPPL